MAPRPFPAKTSLMKIALIRKRYTDFGGAERYIGELASSLVSRGHDVHVYAEEWRAAEGLTFHRVPVRFGPGFLKILSFAYTVRNMLGRERYDIVHSFERTVSQDVYRAGDGCHKEWLRVRRDADNLIKRNTYLLNPMHRAILRLEKELYEDPKLKLIIANSRRGKEEIVRNYGFPEERIRVIYNGINDSLLDPARSKELPGGMEMMPGERMLLFVGSGFERKNLATAIKALARIDDRAVRLWVLGRDRQTRYRRLARGLGVADRVIFAGPRSDPAPFYEHARAFILPTIYEPFSSACLEASAFGLPVVTTRINGFSELIRPGENGFIIENPLDAREAAEKTMAALALGKQPPDQYPSIGDNVKEMLDLYEDVLGEKKSNGR
jgi:UDP-glucose:(heptosyl)LPS alpha-1,3-glucosyltransferase